MKLKQIKTSIIIVYYDGYQNLLELLKSIKENGIRSSYEIIVVNNSNKNIKKNIIKAYRNIVYIRSSGNIGYGRGNNLGAKHARGKYLFIVNPDTEVKENSIEALVDFLDTNAKAAIVAPNLIYNSGEFLENIGTRTLTPMSAIFALTLINKLFPNNPISRRYYIKDLDKTVLREVDTVPGTAFLIRKNIFDKLNGFDNNFFLYFEEFDLCMRVEELGFKIYINPKATVVHDWKPGDGGQKLKKYFEASRFYYFRKHYGILSAFLVEIAVGITKYHIILIVVLSIFYFVLNFR